MKHILVVDDDPDVSELIQRVLSEAGFQATPALTATEALEVAEKHRFDLATVDMVLPGGDGLELTRALRDRHGIGIIIVSGRGATTERIIGLEVGADDYLAKPFSPRELVARVRSVLRRMEKKPAPAKADSNHTYSFDGWRLDVAARELRDPSGNPVELTSGEYKLLEALVMRPNRVLSREQLLELVCSNDMPAFDRSIDVRVGRLRKKLNGEQANLIKTVRNGGYIFSSKVTQSHA
jgi:two-component system, OmpR family, response regulator